MFKPFARFLVLSIALHVVSAYVQSPQASTPSESQQIFLEGTLPAEAYEPPHVKQTAGQYPHSEEYKNREGWVVINTMVDTGGMSYEAYVTESTGNKAFEDAAIRAIGQYEFEPATLDGKPVDAASTEIKFIFKIDKGVTGASPIFVSRYRKFLNALKAGDQLSANGALQLLTVQNLYEDAYHNFARFLFFQKWGNVQQQIEALQRSIAHEEKAVYLPSDTFKAALQQLFMLQVNESDYGGALETFGHFDEETKAMPKWQSMVKEIKSIRRLEGTFALHREIPSRGTETINLLKRHFSVLVTEGKLAEITLYCESRYALIPYEKELDYTIPAEYGKCSMKLTGDKNTQVLVMQF